MSSCHQFVELQPVVEAELGVPAPWPPWRHHHLDVLGLRLRRRFATETDHHQQGAGSGPEARNRNLDIVYVKEDAARRKTPSRVYLQNGARGKLRGFGYRKTPARGARRLLELQLLAGRSSLLSGVGRLRDVVLSANVCTPPRRGVCFSRLRAKSFHDGRGPIGRCGCLRECPSHERKGPGSRMPRRSRRDVGSGRSRSSTS